MSKITGVRNNSIKTLMGFFVTFRKFVCEFEMASARDGYQNCFSSSKNVTFLFLQVTLNVLNT